ncbi:MAG TPA: hypothetical protein DDY49_08010 [Paenibacillaceae bacterium]|nr:hypothetical protein [Paenibacillaceae bacterium]
MGRRYSLDDFVNPERQSEGIKRSMEIIHHAGHGKRPICRIRDEVETRLLIQSILDTIKKEEEGNLIRKGRKWIVR